MAERLPICLAAPLFVILALWGCKGESKPQASVSTAGGAPAAASGASTGNHPPVVRSARIFPSKAMIEMELRVEVQGEDMDGDPITYRYKWLVNKVPAPGASAPQFRTDGLKNGDRITVEVTPNDGKGDGVAFTTDPVTIGNTPPDIAEIHLEPVPLYRGDQLKVTVIAGDPDGDPVTRELKRAPRGMTLDPATKQLAWKLTPENLGKHRVVLAAKDNENAVTQQEFELDAQPPAPAAQQ